jgi:hypothetical protein
MAVVVVDADAEHLLELSPADDQASVEAVAADVPTQSSANAFVGGARNGVRMISTPSLRKTSSKTRLNLLSRS